MWAIRPFNFRGFQRQPAASELRGQTDEELLNENLIVGPYSLLRTNSNGERLLALRESAPTGKLRVSAMEPGFKINPAAGSKLIVCWLPVVPRAVLWTSVSNRVLLSTPITDVSKSNSVSLRPRTEVGLPLDCAVRMKRANSHLLLRTVLPTRPWLMRLTPVCMGDFLEDDLVDDSWDYALRRAAKHFVGFRSSAPGPQWKLDHAPELAKISRSRAAFNSWLGSRVAPELTSAPLVHPVNARLLLP